MESLSLITTDISIPCRIVALVQEQNRLFGYPAEKLADAIQKTGFSCTCCGKCCTRKINQHIFLLDRDIDSLRSLDPAAYCPAPDPEFCDQEGTLYVSGYAVRMKEPDGSCWFLSNNLCRIHDNRFLVCRIYPHMLRRGAGMDEAREWCTFSRMQEHGKYHVEIPKEECIDLAREILEYENAFLTQQISFFETLHGHFIAHGLHHDPAMHAQMTAQAKLGKPVRIKVYHAGELEEFRGLATGND